METFFLFKFSGMISFLSETVGEDARNIIVYSQHFYDMTNLVHVRILSNATVVKDKRMGIRFVLSPDGSKCSHETLNLK